MSGFAPNAMNGCDQRARARPSGSAPRIPSSTAPTPAVYTTYDPVHSGLFSGYTKLQHQPTTIAAAPTTNSGRSRCSGVRDNVQRPHTTPSSTVATDDTVESAPSGSHVRALSHK